MKLNQLKIGHRLALGFGLVVLLMATIVALLTQRLDGINKNNAHIVELQRRAVLADDWRGLVHLNANRALAIAKAGGPGKTADFFGPPMKTTSERISKLQEELRTLVDSDQGKEMLTAISQKREAYTTVRKGVLDILMAGDATTADTMLNAQMIPASEAYLSALEVLANYQRDRVAQASEMVQADVRTAEFQLLAMLAIAVLMAAGFGWLTTRSIVAPLNRTIEATRHIAGGDLSRPIVAEGKDEMAEMQSSLAAMQQSLRTVISEVRAGSDSIGTASAQIASGNQDLSSRTEQTSGNLQQAASSLEELTGTVGQTADSARTANQLAASASQAAQRGGNVVGQVVSTMQDINTSSRRIADIISTIDGIAFQTNILALNAAVEAARAGEQGRGFAVVASEVRSLAQRSAQAAREIKTLIQDSVSKVETGTRLVQDAGSAMDDIVSGVQRVTDVIAEISAATTEQTVGLRQVNEAVADLDQMTQQNAALVEESAAAAESLAEQSRKLGTVVASFTLNETARAQGLNTVHASVPTSAHSHASPNRSAASAHAARPSVKAVTQQVLAAASKPKPADKFQAKAQPQPQPQTQTSPAKAAEPASSRPNAASKTPKKAASTTAADGDWESF